MQSENEPGFLFILKSVSKLDFLSNCSTLLLGISTSWWSSPNVIKPISDDAISIHSARYFYICSDGVVGYAISKKQRAAYGRERKYR